MDRLATPPETIATHTTTDLLVSYPGKQYLRAKSEILRILRRIDAADPRVDNTDVWGLALARSALEHREVIHRCRELWSHAPEAFEAAVKWVPVDYWCETSLPAIKAVINGELRGHIAPQQTWAMRVHKRRWQAYSTEQIIEHLTADMPPKVDLTHPEWIIWIDAVGRGSAVSLLRPSDLFAPLSHHPGYAVS
jgi:tRNA(Ser,Leu) C12 N-acetylase TAN1